MLKKSATEPETTPLAELASCASRRAFCGAAGVGLITLGLAGCDPGDPRIGLGGIDNSPGGGGGGGGGGDLAGQPDQDMSSGSKQDGSSKQDMGSTSKPDMAQNPGSCPTGVLSAGAATSYTSGQSKHFGGGFSAYDVLVCKDANGIYALEASCPHNGCTVNQTSSGGFLCPCHPGTFDFNGTRTGGPPNRSLKHYAVCIDGSGNVVVDYKTTVGATVRV